MWSPFTLYNTTTIISSSDINYNPNYYELPSAVTRSACTPDNASNPLYFYWTTDNATDIFYIYFHFAEVVQLQANESREFNIYINQELWSTNSVVVPSRVRVFTFYSVLPKTGELKYEVSMNKTNDSTLPPIINAFELYSVKLLSILETDKTDGIYMDICIYMLIQLISYALIILKHIYIYIVDAITSIKLVYGVTTRDWQGDPCVPEAFVWDGLNCSYNGFDPARIISLYVRSFN